MKEQELSSPRRRANSWREAHATGEALSPLAKSQSPQGADQEDQVQTYVRASTKSYRSESSLRRYLNEIGEYQRLTPQEELDTAREIQRGSMAARETMINANLRLVVKIARDFEGLGMPINDLINEGNIGLMKAVEHYDPERGVRFSTYAAYWIKQSVKRCLSNQSRTIRVPIHMVEKISKLNQVVHQFREDHQREPSELELAKRMDLPEDEVRAILRAQNRAISLDTPFEEGENESASDRIPDETAPNPYRQLELQTSIHRMCELLDQLQERDSTILRHRYGLEGQDPQTLEEVGRKFGVTRERIRQLQKEALVKLRNLMDDWHPSKSAQEGRV